MSEPLPVVEAALVEHFGHRPQRASVSFVGVDPIEVLRFEPIPGERVYVTLGMARHPMTSGSASILDQAGPRAELMLHLRDPTDEHADVWRRLALLAAAPAVEGVVYVADMSIEIGEPLVNGSALVGALVTVSALDPVETTAGQVEILQVVPASANELGWCRVRGVSALREKWREHEIDLSDLLRRSVRLD